MILFYLFSLAGALKEIQTRIPDIVQIYSLGGTSSALVSAVNLDAKLKESSPAIPVVSHSKSIAGKLRTRQN